MRMHSQPSILYARALIMRGYLFLPRRDVVAVVSGVDLTLQALVSPRPRARACAHAQQILSHVRQIALHYYEIHPNKYSKGKDE